MTRLRGEGDEVMQHKLCPTTHFKYDSLREEFSSAWLLILALGLIQTVHTHTPHLSFQDITPPALTAYWPQLSKALTSPPCSIAMSFYANIGRHRPLPHNVNATYSINDILVHWRRLVAQEMTSRMTASITLRNTFTKAKNIRLSHQFGIRNQKLLTRPSQLFYGLHASVVKSTADYRRAIRIWRNSKWKRIVFPDNTDSFPMCPSKDSETKWNFHILLAVT